MSNFSKISIALLSSSPTWYPFLLPFFRYELIELRPEAKRLAYTTLQRVATTENA